MTFTKTLRKNYHVFLLMMAATALVASGLVPTDIEPVTPSQVDLNKNRMLVLQKIADWSGFIEDGEYWEQHTSIATARLYLNHRVSEANSWLAKTTDRYGTDKNGKTSSDKYPVPHGSTQHDWDFVNMYIVRAYFQNRGNPALSSAAKQNLEKVIGFRAGSPTPTSSENHQFMMACAGYFGNLVTGGSNTKNKNWMIGFLNDKLDHHFYELNSPHYMGAEIKCLLNLIDFAADADLRDKAKAVMDMVMAEMATIHCQGARAGPFYRYYDLEITDHSHDYHYYACAALLGTPWVYDWKNRWNTEYFPRNFGWYTTYKVPQIVMDLAHGDKPPFVLKSRRDFISTIYYVTASCVLASGQDGWDKSLSDSYTGGRAHNWDIAFASSPDKVVFCGSKVGDWAYSEVSSVQKHNVLITSGSKSMVYRGVTPVSEAGWTFIQEDNAYVAIKKLGNGRILVEVRDGGDYGKTFGVFKADVKDNALSVSGDSVTYTNTYGETVRSPSGNRMEGDSFSYQLFDSPYLNSNWGSGTITVKYGANQMTIT